MVPGGRWPVYVYDEYRLTLTPRADGGYDVVGRGSDGVEHRGTFRLPFDDGGVGAARCSASPAARRGRGDA